MKCQQNLMLLRKVNEEMEAQVKEVTWELEQSKNEEKNASDLAKTFSSMKTDEMRPILKNIDDNTVKMIYKNINNRMKKNFLLALTPQRAASLTKQLAVAQVLCRQLRFRSFWGIWVNLKWSKNHQCNLLIFLAPN